MEEKTQKEGDLIVLDIRRGGWYAMMKWGGQRGQTNRKAKLAGVLAGGVYSIIGPKKKIWRGGGILGGIKK